MPALVLAACDSGSGATGPDGPGGTGPDIGIVTDLPAPASLAGTWVRKGDDLRDCGDQSRPHRRSYLIEVPE